MTILGYGTPAPRSHSSLLYAIHQSISRFVAHPARSVMPAPKVMSLFNHFSRRHDAAFTLAIPSFALGTCDCGACGYCRSVRISKHATFALENVRGQPQVMSMTLVDAIQTGQKTVIRYLHSEPKTLPDEVYNPMFLVRNGVDE